MLNSSKQSSKPTKEALRLNPDDTQAKHNLELALKQLQQQSYIFPGNTPDEDW